ncbi:MAG TPA: autotransporter outer membrane beta-barrel domain-containing protein, partial [Steroidobacteraceae bacterium]|nr:autotransporter outer membrane beta-barrel domain-containing protein [Steroidobacteraceae bacterium]
FGSPRGTSNSGNGGGSSQTAAVSVESRRKARHDEGSADLSSRWGLFLNAGTEAQNRKQTDFGAELDSTVTTLSLGADYRATKGVIVGIAGAGRKIDGDFKRGGDFETGSIGATLYASFAPSDAMFIDVSVSSADNEYEVNRRAQFTEIDNGGQFNNFDGILNSETDGTELGAQLQFGYDSNVGRFTMGPRVGAHWTHIEVDGYAEKGGLAGTAQVNGVRGARGLALVFEDQETDSLQGAVGGQISVAPSVGFGALLIQGNADYIHEFDNDQRSVNIRFVQDVRATPRTFQYQTEEPDRDFVRVRVSIVAVLKNGIQPFLGLQGTIANSQFDENYGATLGVRFEL